MGYHCLPSWRNYWSTSDDLQVKCIAESMSRNRFGEILSNLHVNDNSALPDDCVDKLYKLRPLISKLNENFRTLWNPACCISIDESMILFTGRSSMKQYNPMKPIKRGYKVWCRAEKSGFISKFQVYQGKDKIVDTTDIQKKYGMGGKVVITMSEALLQNKHKLFFDNYFSSIPLMEFLKAENTPACATIRSDRKGLPTLKDGKAMERGDSDFRVSNTGIIYFRWKDSKPVHFISNYHGSEETTIKMKMGDGTKKLIPCPEVVVDYNEYMGGVDQADMLRAIYGLDRKSVKWWHRLFWGFMDMAVVNSYIVHSNLNGQMPLLDFRRNLARGLLANCQIRSLTKRRRISYSVPLDMRLQNRGAHWPLFTSSRKRCEVCSNKKIESRPYSICSLCNVHLCINKDKNCFGDYHDMEL